MSVTITIDGNREYCHARGLGRVDADGVAHRPFELNLANANFATLWAALGFDAEPWGDADGRTIAARIAATEPALIERIDTTPAANCWTAGITIDQAARYLGHLATIAREAERRERPVVWG